MARHGSWRSTRLPYVVTSGRGRHRKVEAQSAAAGSFKTRHRGASQHTDPKVIAALFAGAGSVREPPQFSLLFALRAAVLRLAVRGLWSVAPAAAVPVARAVVLGRVNSRSSCPSATMRAWPASSSPTRHVRKVLGLTLRSTGHLAAAHAWPSFHSGPSAVCRKAPVTLYVRLHEYLLPASQSRLERRTQRP